jgi:hypothetical protein
MNDCRIHLKHASTAPRRGRRGFILVIVLGLTVVVTALGMSFMESNSTAMPEAMNRTASVRARYLAESGIALGMHYLMYPPTTVAPGGYWTGGTGIAIDLTSDYTDVAIAQDANDPKLFTIAATGVAKDGDGSIRGKKSSEAEVIVPDDGKWHIPYGVLGGAMDVPATVSVSGDIHANGDLNGLGNCTGNVSASGTATWAGTGPPASVTSGADPYARPPADPALYATYNIRGKSYTAYVFNNSTMKKADADALNAMDMSATNPGRIIMTPVGDFSLDTNVQLIGTLVVRGTLLLENGAVLTAVMDYPAIVVTGNLDVKSNGTAATVVGSIVCGGVLTDWNRAALNLQFTGALILANGFTFLRTDGVYTVDWDQQRATFWDFQRSSEQFPITILSWKED